MRIVAISKVLDEADIVEAFIRHTAVFVDHHVVLDNGSRDGTLDILQALSAEGFPLTVFQAKSVRFNEESYNTHLLRRVAAELRPDWTAYLDVDEFIDDRACQGGFRAALARAGQGEPANVRVPMTNYHPAAGDDAGELLVPRRIGHRLAVTDVRKIIVDGRFDPRRIIVNDGNHDALREGAPLPSTVAPGLTLAHFHERSPAQRVLKYLRGWAKVLAAGPAEIARGTASHYSGFWHATRHDPLPQFAAAAALLPPGLAEQLVLDPIDYRGGPLRYTPAIDSDTRTLRLFMDYAEDLATEYGELIEAVPAARDFVRRRAGGLRLIGSDGAFTEADEPETPPLHRPPARPKTPVRKWLGRRIRSK